ncbi:MAG: hypothetical protein MO846_06155, partial [Candidatus Devosia symbiotica]|nr:hypothetical protein [Candidatus Devosia symbiotica]
RGMIEVYGRIKSVPGLLIEIVGPVRELRVGGRVQIETTEGEHLASEIIGFKNGHALCLPFGQLAGIRLGCRAIFQRSDGAAFPFEGRLSRVININGDPIDSKGQLPRGATVYLLRQNPLFVLASLLIWACAASTPSPRFVKAGA